MRAATHIIHTPAAMFRGWMVMQLKRPEMAQAGEQETRAGISSGERTEPAGGPPWGGSFLTAPTSLPSAV